MANGFTYHAADAYSPQPAEPLKRWTCDHCTATEERVNEFRYCETCLEVLCPKHDASQVIAVVNGLTCIKCDDCQRREAEGE